MNSNISKWLLLQDEKFLSIVKDTAKRSNYLKQLYRQRVWYILGFIFLVILFIIELILGANTSQFMMVSILFGGLGIGYVDIDSRVRAVRVYELLSETGKTS